MRSIVKTTFIYFTALLLIGSGLSACANGKDEHDKTKAEKIEADNSNRDFNRNVEDYDSKEGTETRKDTTLIAD